MSKKIDEGGSAFPTEQHECQDNTWNQTYDPGMSLRDWYIGKLLQGQAAFEGMEGCNVEQWVASAQWIADAVIAARKAKP